MKGKQEAPKTYRDFVAKYPELGKAWDLTREATRKGPLDEHTLHLIKLAIAVGALREGAVHSSVRKALAAGVPKEAIDQVIAAAASILGFPATVAAWTWVEDIASKPKSPT